jgi:hypothetical protein
MTKKFILISAIYLIAVLVGCLSKNVWILGACVIIVGLYPVYKINYFKRRLHSPYIKPTNDNLKRLMN